MIKKIILIILLGACFFAASAKASNDLNLELVDDCVIQHAGDSCLSELKITNNTGESFDCTATLVMYQQDSPFDGQGINVSYNDTTSTWNNGTLTFPTSVVEKGVSVHDLEIQTHVALMPDCYSFVFTITGNVNEKPYTGSTGGGAVYILTPADTDKTSVATTSIPTSIPTDISITTDTISTSVMTVEELKMKIKEIQIKIILLIYQLIIKFLGQLVAIV